MSAPAKEQNNLIILKNDPNFTLREDGDFQCNEHSYPDFSNQETIESFVRMIKYIEQKKFEHPGKEVFLHYGDDAKIELHEYIRPSAVAHAISEIKPNTHNPTHQALVKKQKKIGERNASFADPIVENKIDPRRVYYR